MSYLRPHLCQLLAGRWVPARIAERVDLLGRRRAEPVALRRAEPPLERVQARQGLLGFARCERLGVDAGRAQEGAFPQVLDGHRGPQAFGGVARSDQDRPRRHQALAGIGGEPLVVGLQCVFERRAVHLHGVRQVAEAAREDHRAHQHVVREPRLDLRGRGHVAHGPHVRVEVAGQLLVAEAVEGAHLETLVVVVHVHREQAADVGPVHGAATRVRGPSHVLHDELAVAPRAHRVDETKLFGTPLLTEEVDLVAEAGERLGQLGVVNVRAGSAKQVTVKDEDPHAAASLGNAEARTSGKGARHRSRTSGPWRRLAILPRRETA